MARTAVKAKVAKKIAALVPEVKKNYIILIDDYDGFHQCSGDQMYTDLKNAEEDAKRHVREDEIPCVVVEIISTHRADGVVSYPGWKVRDD